MRVIPVQVRILGSVDPTVEENPRYRLHQGFHFVSDLVHRPSRLVKRLVLFRDSVELNPNNPAVPLPEPDIFVDVAVDLTSGFWTTWVLY